MWTGGPMEWGLGVVPSNQLEQAADYYLQVKAANPPGTIISK